MSAIKDGGRGEIPAVHEQCLADAWDNTIRAYGVVDACEWFGHAPDSAFTAFIIRELKKRSDADKAAREAKP